MRGDVRLHRAHHVQLGRRSRRSTALGPPPPRPRAPARQARAPPAPAARWAARLRASGRRRRRGAPTWSISGRPRRRQDGSPAATRRTASHDSAGGVCLSRKPLAPAAAPAARARRRRTWSARSPRAGPGRALTAPVAAIPSIPGIRMSISTTSGASRLDRVGDLGAVGGLPHDLDVVGAPPSISGRPGADQRRRRRRAARGSAVHGQPRYPAWNAEPSGPAGTVLEPPAGQRHPLGQPHQPGAGARACPAAGRATVSGLRDRDEQPVARRARQRAPPPARRARACGRWSAPSWTAR